MRRLLIVVNDQASFLARRSDIALGAWKRGFEVHVIWPIAEQGVADRTSPMEHSERSIDELVAAGVVRAHPIPMVRGASAVMGEIRTLLAIRRAMRAVAPDIVHQFTIKPAVYGSLAAWTLRPRPLVVNSFVGLGYLFARSDTLGRAIRSVVLRLYGLLAKQGNIVSVFQNADNAATVASAARLAPTSVRVTSGGSGVDLARFPATEPPGGVPLVVLPARMLWDKGIGEFVEAARLVLASGVNARFALVGALDHSNPAAVSRAALEAWRSEGVVEWMGYRSDMAAVFAESTVVCLPSYGEGVPRSLLEAAAVGRPIVTTDVPGCRDVVAHGHNGLLVPMKNAVALAAALQEMLTDRPLARSMGAEGRRMAEQSFSVERVVADTVALYEELLGASAGRGRRIAA